MPPKAKFTKEQIIFAAMDVVRQNGAEALTARSLADALGSSPRPIFTVFESMEEVKSEVKTAVKKLYEGYMDKAMAGEKPFKGSGMGYICFAKNEPEFFRLLFMSKQSAELNLGNVLNGIDDYSRMILQSVQKTFGFGLETSSEIYLHLWIYTHGIASLIVTGVCNFTDEEISYMLSQVCGAIVEKFKREDRV